MKGDTLSSIRMTVNSIMNEKCPVQNRDSVIAGVCAEIENILANSPQSGDVINDVIEIILMMNKICQSSNNGSLDCIINIWRLYTPWPKAYSSVINKSCADMLFAALDTFVTEGLSTCVQSAGFNDKQLGMKLQLLMFFMQRLLATLVHLHRHFGSSFTVTCYHHLCSFRGCLSMHNSEHPDICHSFVPKLCDLYQRLFRCDAADMMQRYAIIAESIKLERHERGKASACRLLGLMELCSWDLCQCSPSGRSISVFTCLDGLVCAAESLTSLYCGTATDQSIRGAVFQSGRALSDTLLAMNSHDARDLLARLFSLCLRPHSATLTPVAETVRAGWATFLLISMYDHSSDSIRREIIACLCSLLRNACRSNVSSFSSSFPRKVPRSTTIRLGGLVRTVLLVAGVRNYKEDFSALLNELMGLATSAERVGMDIAAVEAVLSQVASICASTIVPIDKCQRSTATWSEVAAESLSMTEDARHFGIGVSVCVLSWGVATNTVGAGPLAEKVESILRQSKAVLIYIHMLFLFENSGHKRVSRGKNNPSRCSPSRICEILACVNHIFMCMRRCGRQKQRDCSNLQSMLRDTFSLSVDIVHMMFKCFQSEDGNIQRMTVKYRALRCAIETCCHLLALAHSMNCFETDPEVLTVLVSRLCEAANRISFSAEKCISNNLEHSFSTLHHIVVLWKLLCNVLTESGDGMKLWSMLQENGSHEVQNLIESRRKVTASARSNARNFDALSAEDSWKISLVMSRAPS